MKKSLIIISILLFGMSASSEAKSELADSSHFVLNELWLKANQSSTKVKLDTLGITNGSVHMRGTFKYLDFLKKHKGTANFKLHIWYNQTSSSLSKKEIKAGNNEIYFLYGRNLKTSSIEMEFVFGTDAKAAFSKKKYKELIKIVDLLNFDIFGEENFSGSMAYEAIQKALK
jgi:hypothetical protein